jgi:hypothetical protein
MWPRLDLNSWAEVICLSQSPKLLGLQTYATLSVQIQSSLSPLFLTLPLFGTSWLRGLVLVASPKF